MSSCHKVVLQVPVREKCQQFLCRLEVSCPDGENRLNRSSGSKVHSSVRANPPHLQKNEECCSASFIHPSSHPAGADDSSSGGGLCFGIVLQVFSSPSFFSASLRESFIGPRPENCTVIPCGRNMELDLRRSGCGACACFGGLRAPW